ncbi:DUF1033 family protein [Vagococcus intermedius]|uniref:DUF1033 family protein n=1 Tax=Vagococcus intermedius TaxID=2991418 RepID=A0AAF0CUH4_9ENTE|nr:DUF1033 family protein [Vagococcus intermedius]WEG72952.1 DUF1033 family protein [Vagococcus intermedius]WEG75038.1 DUF1033 family protein [Vagococcus intermedius]
MYQVIVMYGENEPWWFFEDWELDIVEEDIFDNLIEAKACYREKFAKLHKEYSMIKEKSDYLTAFWEADDLRYCEECDEDLQLYKGLMLLKDCKKLSEAGKELDETINYRRKAKCCQRPSAGTRSNEEN